MSTTRSRVNEAWQRHAILREALDAGRFDPQRGQAAVAKRLWKDGFLEPIVGCSEAYRITATGRAELRRSAPDD